jgi:hypothetical protein
MQRTTMQINALDYLLAQGQDVNAIKEQILTALRDGAGIITTTLVGNRELDILISPGVAITFQTEEVPEDDRDDGDLASPFDSPGYDHWLS